MQRQILIRFFRNTKPAWLCSFSVIIGIAFLRRFKINKRGHLLDKNARKGKRSETSNEYCHQNNNHLQI